MAKLTSIKHPELCKYDQWYNIFSNSVSESCFRKYFFDHRKVTDYKNQIKHKYSLSSKVGTIRALEIMEKLKTST